MIYIFGKGRIGTVLYDALSHLEYKVKVIDTEKYDPEDLNLFAFPTNTRMVVSCANPTVDYHVFLACERHRIPYANLGGDEIVSQRIKRESSESNMIALCELGLAPGFVQAFAYSYISDYTRNLAIYCGGIPKHKGKNLLNYVTTWSEYGIYENYTNLCYILDGKVIVTKHALSDLENLEEFPDLEAFNTPGITIGFLEHLKNNTKVLSCCYKTLRYKGHRDVIKEILSVDRNFIIKYLKKIRGTDDCVEVLVVTVDDLGNRRLFRNRFENNNSKYSTLAACTASGAASAIDTYLKLHKKEPYFWMMNEREYTHYMETFYSLLEKFDCSITREIR